MLPDIVELLDGDESTFGATRQGEGSVPKGFTPSTVISCQSREQADGSTTIDAVSLDGDIAAVVKALSRPSERPDENTSVECAYGTFAPAAIWLVSAAGAVRAAWPETVCNLRDDPLVPLEALTETRRSTVQQLGRSPAADCRGAAGIFRTTKNGEGGGAAPPFTRRPTVRLPQGPVAALTACTYRNTRTPSGEVYSTLLIDRAKLSAEASTRLVREVLAAPEASPCDHDATGVVAATLYRPDGSGGGTLTMESDGCRRVMVNDLVGYRTAPPDAATLLEGDGI